MGTKAVRMSTLVPRSPTLLAMVIASPVALVRRGVPRNSYLAATSFSAMNKQRRAQREGADATNGALATVGATAPTPLATVMRDHVGSKASTPRRTRAAAGEDPSLALKNLRAGPPADASIEVGGSDAKSLIAKGKSPDFLSLTLPKRPPESGLSPILDPLPPPSDRQLDQPAAVATAVSPGRSVPAVRSW